MQQHGFTGTIPPYEEVERGFVPRLADYYAHPEKYRLEPFRIFGNLYYVGDQKVCCHLVDTGEGLILFDTGYPHTTHLLTESIRKLGFDPKDLRYIIHSHGHFDHFGGGDALRSVSGAAVCMSAEDTGLLRERPDRALLHWGPSPSATICWPDRELEDGDRIHLGNTDIRCVLTPGHTCGTMSFFFPVTDGKTRLQAGYMGGVGAITVYKAHNLRYGLPLDKCKRLLSSVRKVWDEPVDIVLGNHPSQNGTLEKHSKFLLNPEKNPFIDAGEWHRFLKGLEERFLKFEQLGY